MGSDDQQLTDVLVAEPADPAEPRLAAGGSLPRHEAKPGRELPPATPRHAVAATPATAKTPRATVTAKTATPPPTEATTSDEGASDPPVACYEPGTPQYVVRELWLRLNHQPIQSDITAALGEAGLANSEQQARKIRAQVRKENPGLPGPRAA